MKRFTNIQSMNLHDQSTCCKSDSLVREADSCTTGICGYSTELYFSWVIGRRSTMEVILRIVYNILKNNVKMLRLHLFERQPVTLWRQHTPYVATCHQSKAARWQDTSSEQSYLFRFDDLCRGSRALSRKCLWVFVRLGGGAIYSRR